MIAVEGDISLKIIERLMKKIAIAILLLALLCAGCVDKKDDGSKDEAGVKTVSEQQDEKAADRNQANDKSGDQSGDRFAPQVAELSTSITSPRPGEILTGNKEFEFASSVSGGKEPYTYSWTSNIDGILSTEKSFRQDASELSKGEHNLILKVTDSSGNSAQSTALIRVM
jgi:hypothetical protein